MSVRMKLEAHESSSTTGRRTCLRTVLIGAVLTGLVPAAWAGSLDYRVGAGAYLGVTDNALGVPSDMPGSGSDGILLGRLAGGLVLKRPFSDHRLAYAFTGSMYMRQTGGRTLSNSLGWESAVTPSTGLRMTIGVTGTQGRLSALDVASTSATGGPPAGPTGARPAAAFLYATADAREGLSWELNPDWRFLQALGVQGFWPLNAGSRSPSSYSGDLSTGIERTFLRDGLSLNLRGVAMQSNEFTAADGTPAPRRRLYIGQSDLGWRHTWSPTWSHYLSGGAMAIESPPGSKLRWKPTGQGSVMARTEMMDVTLRVERGATPNVYAGDIFISTRAMLTGSAGFGSRQQVDVRVLGSYDRASAVSQAGADLGGATVYQARVIGTYGAPGPLYFSLEYAFTDQEARIPENVVLPRFFTFHRHLVMVGVEYRYSSLRPVTPVRRGPRGAGSPEEDPRP